MKYDCSKTLDYAHEFKRFCDGKTDCKSCEIGCEAGDTLQEHIDRLQKWSDAHPEQTMQEKFFEMFPNAPRNNDGTPNLCPDDLGWAEKPNDCNDCVSCWSRPYTEVQP